MSRKLLAFLLSERNTVRIVCQGKNGKPCGTVLEIPLANLSPAYATMQGCKVCGNSFGYFDGVGTPKDPFAPLAYAIQNLRKIKDQVDLEFVLPDNG